MYESYLLSRPWLVASIWAVLYISDYYLTLWGARIYRRQKFVVNEGSYELTPECQDEVDKQNPLSIVFVVWLAGIAAFLLFAGSLDSPRELYGFFTGLAIVPVFCVQFRHIGNVIEYRRLAGPDPGVTGSIAISRRNAYIRSSTDLAFSTAVCLVLFLLVGSYIFLGGSLSLSILFGQHLSLARHLRTSAAKDRPETVGPLSGR